MIRLDIERCKPWIQSLEMLTQSRLSICRPGRRACCISGWFVMPLVVTCSRSAPTCRDVREGRPTVLWAFFKDPTERRRLFRSGLKDFGRSSSSLACSPPRTGSGSCGHSTSGELLVVAVACAIVPYFLIRGPVTRIACLLRRKWAGQADQPAANTKNDTEPRPEN